jgi:hypothetical protein
MRAGNPGTRSAVFFPFTEMGFERSSGAAGTRLPRPTAKEDGMAEITHTHTHEHSHEEMCAVQSRVSWGAVMAGAVVALAVYLVMTLLGAAIGLSAADVNGRNPGLTTGAGIWAVATTIVALFAGGWVAAQSVVGETKGEAVVHSIIMWGVVMAMIMWLVASGARAGFSAMVGFSTFADNMGRQGMIADTQQRTNAAVTTAERSSNDLTNDPAQREALRSRASEATWWALVGTLLSMAAAIFGGYIGGGTHYRWLSHGMHPHYHRPGAMPAGA